MAKNNNVKANLSPTNIPPVLTGVAGEYFVAAELSRRDYIASISLRNTRGIAEGDLPQASALLAPLHPNADDTPALETQVYQAILERQPTQIIARLKEILAKPDPALGYINGELRSWLC